MIALIAAAVAVSVAIAAPPPGAAPYLSRQHRAQRKPSGAGRRNAATATAAYGAVAQKRKHPLWEACLGARLTDSERRPWDFFRDMDQDALYKHENVFKNLDLDGNSELNKEEFWFAFSGTPESPAKEKRTQMLWDKDDKDPRDGVISFAEFNGFKGIGDGNNLVDHSEFISFFRRNRRVACFALLYAACCCCVPSFPLVSAAMKPRDRDPASWSRRVSCCG
jgi:hypothetical protein